MRLSTHEEDPSYHVWVGIRDAGKVATAYLNGEKVRHCSTADEEIGYVECAIPERGTGNVFCLGDAKGRTNHVAIQILYGKVKIEIH